MYPESVDERMELKKLVCGVRMACGFENASEVVERMIERHVSLMMDKRKENGDYISY